MHTAPALGGGSAAELVGRRALVSQRAGEEEQEDRSGSQGRGKIKVETLGVSVAVHGSAPLIRNHIPLRELLLHWGIA